MLSQEQIEVIARVVGEDKNNVESWDHIGIQREN
jgi:hypothetical protein